MRRVEALELSHREHPEVVLMDLRMPRMDGVEATRRIHEELPDTGVLVLTTYADDESLFPALEAGARGYLTKEASAEEIERATRSVNEGRTHLDPAGQERLLAAALDARPVTQSNTGRLPDDLTPREAEVLKLVAEGLSSADIARGPRRVPSDSKELASIGSSTRPACATARRLSVKRLTPESRGVNGEALDGFADCY